MLTPKQKIVLRSIKGYFAKHGETPSIRQLRDEAAHNGLLLKSLRSILLYLHALEEGGYIRRDSKDRRIELVNGSGKTFIDIPVLGAASAGDPTQVAEQRIEGYLKVSKRLLGTKNVFAIQVHGDSMDLTRVNGKIVGDGDYVIVDSDSKDYVDGDRVVVVVDGLATIKIYRRLEGNVIGLFPNSANKRHQPIYITPEDDFVVNGKVIDVFENDN